MLMHDHPLLVNFAEANSRAPPHIELSSVCPCRAEMAERASRPINGGAAVVCWARPTSPKPCAGQTPG
jgi:hypothetical protein